MGIPASITTPDTVPSRLGTLEFNDGATTPDTAERRTTTWISTDLYFGPPQAPAGKKHNWIETIPDKGWFPILCLYSPLQPFFDKSWRPSEIEPHNPGYNGHQPEPDAEPRGRGS